MSENKDDNAIVMPTYVVKMKQDRYGTWICSEMRIQADTIKELNKRMNACSRAVSEKTKKMNKVI